MTPMFAHIVHFGKSVNDKYVLVVFPTIAFGNILDPYQQSDRAKYCEPMFPEL
jgi:hypothetical protein